MVQQTRQELAGVRHGPMTTAMTTALDSHTQQAACTLADCHCGT